MTPKLLLSLRALALATLICFMSLVSETAYAVDRIAQPIDNANVARLHGSVHPMARTAADLGTVGGTMILERMELVFSPTPAQQSALDLLLRQQQDASSPNYHKWLTPEQFADRFGLSQSDFNKIAAWLRSQGFQIVESAPSRNYIAFNGSAAQVQATFRTPIHRYSVLGEVHYANATEPSIPAALAGVVSGVRSLNNFRPKPRLVRPLPRVTSSATGNHFMQPGDFATIYNLTGLYNSGLDGTGQSIAVMGQTDLFTDSSGNFTDVATFRTNVGLSAPNLRMILVTSDPGIVSGDIDEANLDVEWAGGIAKNASIIYVNSKNGAFDALQYAVTNNVAPVLSISYGLCEQQLDTATKNSMTTAGQQANAQGQTIVAPSGDSGAADCDNTGSAATQGLAVDFPASMPYATSMGGSEFTGDSANTSSPCTATQYWGGGTCQPADTSATALSYIPETVWNDTAIDGVLSAGGGGVSTLFTKPTWQTGTGVPSDGQRDVPDISLSSSADHDGYLICTYDPTAQTHSCVCGFRNSCTIDTNTTQGSFSPTGGTSAAVPAFAAVVALINQKMGAAQGNVNPNLYTLAGTTPTAFHDITTGNNIVPCTQGSTNCPTTAPFQIGYSAAAGYDLASGLGSFDAGALVAAWSGVQVGDFQLTASPTSLALSSGSTGTSTISTVVVGGFSGTVTLTCSVSSSLGATTCALSPNSIVGAGSSTLTIHGATLAAGINRRPRFSPRSWGMESSSLMFAAVLLLPASLRRGGSRLRHYGINSLLTLLLLTLVVSISSCGGGGGGGQTTTPLSGTVTVTATSGSLSHTAQVAVTIN